MDISWLATFCAVVAFIVILRYFLSSIRLSPKGKAVLITGCDSGFGQALAATLSSLNYHVFALCLNEKTPLHHCDVIQCDVTKDDDVTRALQAVQKKLDENKLKLWAVVNNAGIIDLNYVEWESLESYQKQMDVNFIGMIRILQAFLPMVRQCKGRVVNIASQASKMSLPYFSAYSASKHAVLALSNSLRIELRRFGVRVLMIQPTYYKTPILDYQIVDSKSRAKWNERPEHIRNDYTQEFFDNCMAHKADVIAKSARNDVTEVTDAMTHAVTSQWPYDVYECHWTTSLSSFVMNLLPYWLADRILEFIYVPRG